MDEYQFFKKLCENKSLDTINFKVEKKIQEQYFQSLKNKGLNISYNGSTFTLNEKLIPLDKDKIESNISSLGLSFNHKINILYQTTSTNIEVNKYNDTAEFTILLAEYQSLGKGRRGNQWISPLGKNIYLTIKFKQKLVKNISRFPIDIATIIADKFFDFGIKNIKIKWPNDIYINNSKLGGVIVERIFGVKNQASLILGIGLNVNMDDKDQANIDKQITSLKKGLAVNYFDRNILLAHLLTELTQAIKTNFSSKKDSIKTKFEKYNLLTGQELFIKLDNKKIFGKYVDINDDGSLKVFSNNKYMDLYAGDVSIKGWNNI